MKNNLHHIPAILAAICFFQITARASEAEVLPKGAKLKQLTVFPAKIQLKGPFDYSQVILTADYENGDRADVTRVANIKAANGIISVSKQGLVSPVMDGSTQIVFEFEGQKKDIPVQVVDFKKDIPVSFLKDVMPLLARSGCNQATCHGAAEGKNGFKLSLRGYDSLFDHIPNRRP